MGRTKCLGITGEARLASAWLRGRAMSCVSAGGLSHFLTHPGGSGSRRGMVARGQSSSSGMPGTSNRGAFSPWAWQRPSMEQRALLPVASWPRLWLTLRTAAGTNQQRACARAPLPLGCSSLSPHSACQPHCLQQRAHTHTHSSALHWWVSQPSPTCCRRSGEAQQCSVVRRRFCWCTACRSRGGRAILPCAGARQAWQYGSASARSRKRTRHGSSFSVATEATSAPGRQLACLRRQQELHGWPACSLPLALRRRGRGAAAGPPAAAAAATGHL